MSAKTVPLVQMNDTHAYLTAHPELFRERGQAVYRRAGGYARICTLVKEMRAASKEALLFCDNGDAFHGTHPAVATQGRALLPVLNMLGLAATTGHREFAYGPAAFRQRAEELAYPVLASNVYLEATMVCALTRMVIRAHAEMVGSLLFPARAVVLSAINRTVQTAC